MLPLRDGVVAPAERGGQSAFRQQHARVHLDARPAALHQRIDEKVPRLPFGEYRLGDQVAVQRREIADLAVGHVDLGLQAGHAQLQRHQSPAGHRHQRRQAAAEGIALVVDVGRQRRGQPQRVAAHALHLDLHRRHRRHAAAVLTQFLQGFFQTHRS